MLVSVGPAVVQLLRGKDGIIVVHSRPQPHQGVGALPCKHLTWLGIVYLLVIIIVPFPSYEHNPCNRTHWTQATGCGFCCKYEDAGLCSVLVLDPSVQSGQEKLEQSTACDVCPPDET